MSNQDRIHEVKEKYGDMNLIDMVYTFLEEEDKKQQKKRIESGRYGKFYPSSIDQCKRKIAYQMLGYLGVNKTGRILTIMENGTYFHERMEDTFERMGILIAPELKLKDKQYRISGRSDAIIWNTQEVDETIPGINDTIELEAPVYDKNGHIQEKGEQVYKGAAKDIVIVEFKSIRAKNYDKLPKTKPERKHELQLQLYFYLTGIRMGKVFYENKDTQEQKYYDIKYNEELVNEVLSEIENIIAYVDQNKLPNREFEPTSFECRFCDFRDVCHPLENQYDLDDII